MIDLTALIQYAILFAVAALFTVIALERKTILSTLLCAVIWIFDGVINFVFAPTSIFTYGMSMLFWVIGTIFMAQVLYVIYEMHFQKKATGWEPF